MVQIKIKGLKDGLHLFAQFDDETIFLKELEKRLKAISMYGKAIEAFFIYPMSVMIPYYHYLPSVKIIIY